MNITFIQLTGQAADKWRAEHFIGDVINEPENDYVTVKKPIVIVIRQMQVPSQIENGQLPDGMQVQEIPTMMPPSLFMEHIDFDVPRKDIAYMGKASEEVSRAYKEQFGQNEIIEVHQNLESMGMGD